MMSMHSSVWNDEEIGQTDDEVQCLGTKGLGACPAVMPMQQGMRMASPLGALALPRPDVEDAGGAVIADSVGVLQGRQAAPHLDALKVHVVVLMPLIALEPVTELLPQLGVLQGIPVPWEPTTPMTLRRVLHRSAPIGHCLCLYRPAHRQAELLQPCP